MVQERFDLHAAVHVPAGARDRLEAGCRHALRPLVAQDRLALTTVGQVVLRRRHPWSEGITHLSFDPFEFLERLAVLPFDSAQGTPSAAEGWLPALGSTCLPGSPGAWLARRLSLAGRCPVGYHGDASALSRMLHAH